MRPLHAIALYLRNRDDWDALCARCGRCCFEREVGVNGAVEVNYAEPCEFLDLETHLCRVYDERLAACSRCHQLTPFHVLLGRYLPEECAYMRALRRK